jgi:hypothetical protein
MWRRIRTGLVGDRWPHDAPLTAAGGLSRPTFAIANISLSVRADDKGRHSALFFNVPLGMNMSWQRGCRVCCI